MPIAGPGGEKIISFEAKADIGWHSPNFAFWPTADLHVRIGSGYAGSNREARPELQVPV